MAMKPNPFAGKKAAPFEKSAKDMKSDKAMMGKMPKKGAAPMFKKGGKVKGMC
jgi:hypothetical protein